MGLYFLKDAIGRASITYEQAVALLGGPMDATLKARFRQKSLEAHPDRGGSLEAMRNVNEAYDILTGKTKPAPSYDHRPPPQPKRPQPPKPNSPPPGDNPWAKWHNPKYDAGPGQKKPEDEWPDAWAYAGKKEQEARARAERQEQQKKREQASRAYRQQYERSNNPAPQGVPREAVARARKRMYDAYDRAVGDPDLKFSKMLIALRSRIRATKEPEKREGIREMLRQETEDPAFRHRWTTAQIINLKAIRQGI